MTRPIREEMWSIVDKDGDIVTVDRIKPVLTDYEKLNAYRVVKVLVVQWTERNEVKP